jgi:hypothetical protein
LRWVTMFDWLEPRELNLLPTEVRMRAARTIHDRVSGVAFFVTFLLVFFALWSVAGAARYALFGQFNSGGAFEAVLVAIIIGFVAGVADSLLFRQRRARECRKLLCEYGIPVCVNCGYDLRGQTEPRCPECGRGFDPKLIPGACSAGEHSATTMGVTDGSLADAGRPVQSPDATAKRPVQSPDATADERGPGT